MNNGFDAYFQLLSQVLCLEDPFDQHLVQLRQQEVLQFDTHARDARNFNLERFNFRDNLVLFYTFSVRCSFPLSTDHVYF